MYKAFIKRWVDVILSLIGIICFLPLMGLISFILAIHHRGKIFFIQERAGIGGKTFNIIKFKTMEETKEPYSILLSDMHRVTSFGKILRSFSLDELPQLMNVLKGEMSMVGPRPLLIEYQDLYTAEQAKRSSVKPGITGLAQINGRNAISWEQKFELDVYYVENISLTMDFKIFIKTFVKIIKRDGVNAGENITMEKFKGSLSKARS